MQHLAFVGLFTFEIGHGEAVTVDSRFVQQWQLVDIRNREWARSCHRCRRRRPCWWRRHAASACIQTLLAWQRKITIKSHKSNFIILNATLGCYELLIKRTNERVAAKSINHKIFLDAAVMKPTLRWHKTRMQSHWVTAEGVIYHTVTHSILLFPQDAMAVPSALHEQSIQPRHFWKKRKVIHSPRRAHHIFVGSFHARLLHCYFNNNIR